MESIVVTADALPVDEQAKAILEREFSVLGIVKLLFEGGTKSG